MGGNVSVKTVSGEEVRAEKVDLRVVGRQTFMRAAKTLFLSLNRAYINRFGEVDGSLWPNERDIEDSTVFNGSTSFVLCDDFADEEILQVKPTVGDIDIAVPAERGENLFLLLYDLRGKYCTDEVKFVGMNRTSSTRIGNQINCLFEFNTTPGTGPYLVQVDFELLPFENNSPTEWAKFSHSSSFKDAQVGIKAVHHKYLIRAMIGALSVRKDIVVATPKSTPDHIKIAKQKDFPRFLKFSVDRGVRVAYKPMLLHGEPVEYDGKKVYQEIPTSESDYKQTLRDIFVLAFNDEHTNDIKKLWDFRGVLELIKKYLSKDAALLTAARYFELLWGAGAQRAQELERDNPEADASLKIAGWDLFRKTLKIPNPPHFEERLEAYYKDYGNR